MILKYDVLRLDDVVTIDLALLDDEMVSVDGEMLTSFVETCSYDEEMVLFSSHDLPSRLRLSVFV